MAAIAPDETLIRGAWFMTTRGMETDAACSRIAALVQTRLIKVATSSDGWNQLFRDPADGRLWELTYPQSSFHGGGPPCLKLMSPHDALRSFGYSGSV